MVLGCTGWPVSPLPIAGRGYSSRALRCPNAGENTPISFQRRKELLL